MNRLLFSDNRRNRNDNRLCSPGRPGGKRLVEPVTVPNGVMTASGGNYQLTLPMSATVQFYQLSEQQNIWGRRSTGL
jgi:hypothetical protein